MRVQLLAFGLSSSKSIFQCNNFLRRASYSTFISYKKSTFVLSKTSTVSSRNMSDGGAWTPSWYKDSWGGNERGGRNQRGAHNRGGGRNQRGGHKPNQRTYQPTGGPSKMTKIESGSKVLSFGAGSKDFLEQLADQRKSVCSSVLEFSFDERRCRKLSVNREFKADCGGIVYWMSRDQRVQDNWALLYAQQLAMKHQVPLYVCFCLVPKSLEANIRQYGFMLKGLEEVERELQNLDISFHLLTGYAVDVLPQFVTEMNIGGVVTDFSPLRTPLKWVRDVTAKLPRDVSFVQVDAHNIVPCWETSDKQEHRAYIIRGKIMDKLPTYLTEFPPVCKHPHPSTSKPEPVDWVSTKANLEVDRTVAEVTWATPGSVGGLRQLELFCKERLEVYAADRNKPDHEALSDLSPWYHFGHVSVQRSILTVQQFQDEHRQSVEKYIDEAVIWREMAENSAYYNPDRYDSLLGAPEWAQETLRNHAGDKRQYIYSREQLEQARTHDDLWNAAQIQMVQEGKMHGFLRMYWAKMILEWTPSPEVALEEAIYLNDKYNLDGRDPNGYAGCMWAIGGLHDRDFQERPIYGKIRFMTYFASKRKFDVPGFVKKYGAKAYK
ncbi:deoxyribodipyrimidine photo-lyase-like [Branchiostoma lanceolatum]|uniref:deoxyribodipyrimidine photo-lyase-like n=1 Tax=Branchiostoma lanceolatum TaxID=7740 RepID=UPI003457318F